MSIDASLVKKLREETGSGMMDCKKALTETNGEFEKAKDYLRKKGEAKAEKKSSRSAGEGRIGSYIHHNGKVGTLVELRTETDFVARNEAFSDLLKTLCMQVAATAPIALRKEDIPDGIIERERAVYAESDEVLAKSEKIRPKIVEGKLKKFYKSACLLEQSLVSDETKTVGDLIKESVAKFGENITLVRFARFELGESDGTGE
jgi:elongation factor Ts